jgi:defect-in-organelle-trafficking protein DotD
MQIKLTFLLIFSLLLSACSSNTPRPPSYALTGTEASLAEASYAVSRSISNLSATAQAARPYHRITEPPHPTTFGMEGLSTVDWAGPVEPLVRQIAKAANYRVRVLGTAPAIPVLVSIYDQNMMLGDILRDVGYQCGRRAEVIIFPHSRVIELRYAKN